LSVKIRAGSRFKRFLCFVLIDGVAYHRLKTIGSEDQIKGTAITDVLWPRYEPEIVRIRTEAAFWGVEYTAIAHMMLGFGICGGQNGTEAGFLRVLLFTLPLIPPTAPHSPSSGAGTVGQTVADVPSGLNLTPPEETKKKN
jgi:hypothetical protein